MEQFCITSHETQSCFNIKYQKRVLFFKCIKIHQDPQRGQFTYIYGINMKVEKKLLSKNSG